MCTYVGGYSSDYCGDGHMSSERLGGGIIILMVNTFFVTICSI